MAISFVGSKTFTHALTSPQSCSLTDLLDTGGASVSPQAGDVVVVNFVNASTADISVSPPSGYTGAHTDLYANDSNDTNMLVSYKVMPASPDTTVSIPASDSTSNGVACTVHCFRGVDNNTVLDVTTTTATGTNTGVADAPSVTPSTAGAWIVVCGGAGVAAGAVFTNPSGLSATTNHFRSATITSTTIDANAGTGLNTSWSSGAYNPAVFGGSTSTNTGSWAAASVVLRPARPSVGTFSKTEAGDTFSGVGKVVVTGSLSKTEASDTKTIAGTVPDVGTLTKTEAGDTISAAGTSPAKGTLSKTEASDSITAVSKLLAAGSLTGTEAADTTSSTARAFVLSAVSKTEASDTLTAAGTVASAAITGTLTETEAADTLAAIAEIPALPVARLAVTEHSDNATVRGRIIGPNHMLMRTPFKIARIGRSGRL